MEKTINPNCENITAIYIHPNSGYEDEQEEMKKYSLGQPFKVDDILMSSSHTNIKIGDELFNSVMFDFYEIDPNTMEYKEINIYNDKRFNHYI